MHDDLSSIFKTAAIVCAKASGSSFGTLLAQGLLVAARDTREQSTLTRADIAKRLSESVQVLSARGGAVLGDNTVLDAMDAVASAPRNAADGDDLRVVAVKALRQRISTFRDKPAHSTGSADAKIIAGAAAFSKFIAVLQLIADADTPPNVGKLSAASGYPRPTDERVPSTDLLARADVAPLLCAPGAAASSTSVHAH